MLDACDNYVISLWNQLHSLIVEQWDFISDSFGTLVSLLVTHARGIKLWLEGISFCCISVIYFQKSIADTWNISRCLK